jgi:hypothetical protein
MKRVITNDTLVPLFVMGYLLQPGQSRDVEVPDELASAVPEGSPEPVDPNEANTVDLPPDDAPQWPERLVALQKLAVAKLKPQLEVLTSEDLQTLGQIEEAAEQPRSSVLELLAAAQLKLARANTGEEQP